MQPRILFLLKKNLIYGSYSSIIAKSGLLNSARITSHQLEKHLDVRTSLEVCVDANEIDKFLHKHKPAICILEAIWCPPAKLRELGRLHRNILFIVLIHSEMPFLAQEGMAIKWIKEYNEIANGYVAFNSRETWEQFQALGIFGFYLPNVYLDVEKGEDTQRNHHTIQIGCFGAIRPFKNQVMQAAAAIVFANQLNKTLFFHINSTRIEQIGDGVLKNIKALFEGTAHELVEHGWAERPKFLALISQMDLGMQVSISESFNIVAADFVHQHVPIVVSKTIDWMPDIAKANFEDMDEIVSKMSHAFNHRSRMANKNTRYLQRYNRRSLEQWKDFLSL